ncbi:hypothetical protein EIN_151290 [Entamoeba invadens IP1]|uniref:Signal recognition particle subunit SRP72 n=1 Tax=Entamoeba invadens IP1 TaxID=370355 RepID=A0A0A1U8R0_ENTIV|nr:hypothetical protein EIN_151290 [Entamoeba invadens IP1]ELP91232.1 hypothetical protein EIN_151290 [Entamoeba invadens IP1]|eukprot:XP_004258003.1 hypothetical protein EIN_151290 [Entamoeba invadens IP1]
MDKLTQLIAQNNEEDLKEIHAISTEMYKQNPNDGNVFKVLIVSSLRLKKDVTKYHDEMIKSQMTFEAALNLFNNNQNKDALKLLTGTSERETLLKAQINQKLGNYKEAANMYAEILKTTKLAKTGILTNLAACIASDKTIDYTLLGSKTSDFNSQTFGNAAMVMLQNNEFTKAESYLNKALGASALTDTKTEETEDKAEKDEAKEKALKKRKEKRQRRRQNQMIKKYGKKDVKTLNPERWVPMYQRKRANKKNTPQVPLQKQTTKK